MKTFHARAYLYGDNPEKRISVTQRVAFDLVRNWLQENRQFPLLLQPPQIVVSEAGSGSSLMTGSKHVVQGTALHVEIAPPPDETSDLERFVPIKRELKPITLDFFTGMFKAFCEKHQAEPTHLLLPPRHALFSDAAVWFFQERITDNPPLKDGKFYGLTIVENCPCFCMAIL